MLSSCNTVDEQKRARQHHWKQEALPVWGHLDASTHKQTCLEDVGQLVVALHLSVGAIVKLLGQTFSR